MARPMSSDLAAIAVLITAPEPASLQAHLPPANLSNQPSPLAIIVGFVSRKKPTRIVSGTLPAASKERAGKPAVSAAPLMRAVFRKMRLSNTPNRSCDIVSSFSLRVSHASGTLGPEQLTGRLIAARPVDDPMFDREQQPVDQQAHDADRQHTDENVVRAEEPSGIQNHPTETRTPPNNLAATEF